MYVWCARQVAVSQLQPFVLEQVLVPDALLSSLLLLKFWISFHDFTPQKRSIGKRFYYIWYLVHLAK
ncbi:hypothetical protein EB796_022971 [Bugula neritina]|uniref:Uncharacterized protein n=1 Tax=Bugula neritina TaxID=10212 RepID=A0A7J7IZR7_BUGNE|nr:hypothetical protein EB796_022971 [Bugula neritina]